MSAGTAFATIRTEGAILPPDILNRIAAGDKDLGGLTEAAYHLTGEKFGEATNRAWNRLQSAWLNFQTARENLAAGDPGTTIARERWLLPLFQLLDYGRLQIAKAQEIGSKSYAISHAWQHVPIHLVGCNVDLDSRHRGTSPHSLLQEFLNRSEGHLWGIVSNGLRLRLLRDNISLTRQAYVDFDLEAMMAGEAYPDFVLLWLLLHQSRFEGERPELAWIEKWSQAARTEGVRVLDGLRDGVQRAIESLGQGALAHPANAALRETLRSGSLDKQDYYRELLRLVYRLIFLFVAEDRNLLLDPAASAAARERYTKHYAIARIRRLAISKAGSRHDDLYRALKFVMIKLSSDGCPELALPALGSFLFSPNSMPHLDACEVSNRDLLTAVRSLAVTQTKQGRRGVDYKNLGAEELGSVYESLLELHPAVDTTAALFELRVAAGSERKTSGSYYTPSSLISCLLDSALDPVLNEASNQPNPEAAILRLKVVDPACGSGHFLIAAAHRMAKRLAAVRTSEEEPPPDAQRKALRNVIGHCVYGVDLNPMAVELCKVSLWMEALEPGKPLSFLEHRIQCGNSLLGATPALLAGGIPDEAFTPIEGDDKDICKEFKRINKDERNKQLRMFAATTEPWQQLGNFAASLMNLDTVGDDSIGALREKERMYEEAIRSGNYLDGRFWADTWCAAFVWKKTREFNYPITEAVFRRIERNPHTCEPWMRVEIELLARQYRFFHWQLAFPDVFHVPPSDDKPENTQSGWSGGFDVVLGNPPWERIKLQEKEWFAPRRPDISNAPNAAARRKMIVALANEDPHLLRAFHDELREVEGEALFIRYSERYPLCGQGDVNTYAAFAETNRNLLSSTGRVGCIVPSGIALDMNTKDFFQALVEGRELVSLYSFENEEFIFPSVHHFTKFCLLTLSGKARPQQTSDFLFFARQTSDLRDEHRHFALTAADIALLNPNTHNCCTFRSKQDAEISKRIYRNAPVFIREAASEENVWQVSFLRMFDMASDSRLFLTTKDLSSDSDEPKRESALLAGKASYLPLYEGKFLWQFNHRFSGYETRSGERGHRVLPESTNDFLSDPTSRVTPYYWVRSQDVESRLPSQWDQRWLIGWRDVTTAITERTVVATIMPLVGVGHTCPLLFPMKSGARLAASLLANLDSLPLDYVARQKLGGIHLTYNILGQLPVLSPTSYETVIPWQLSVKRVDWLLPRVVELVYTDWSLEPFGRSCGYLSPPFKWNLVRRLLLQCEIDAAFFHFYGLERSDVEHILDSFNLVRDRDTAEYSEYRSKRIVVEIYDAMAEAETTGVSYQTRLDPPPGDPRVAHAPTVAAQTPLAPIPRPMLVPSLDLVANGAWTTPPGIQPGNFVLLAVTEVLHRFGGPVDPHRVWMAVHFVRNPAMALAFLDKAGLKDWVRVIGPGSLPVQKNVIDISRFRRGATDQLWGDAIIYLKSIGALVESSGLWSVTSTAPPLADEQWLAGRADIAVRLASKLAGEEETELRLVEFLRSVEDGTARRAVS